jgi:PAS domain-containing protein
VEYRIICPQDEVRFVRSTAEAIRNDKGEPVSLTGATQDVTDQVKARELLRQSEERLKNAQRLAHVGNWHWDLKTNQVTWSEECFRIFGRPPDFTPSHESFLQAIVPEDREQIERGSRHRLEAKSGSSIEFRIV